MIYDVNYEAVAELDEFITFYTPAPGGIEVQYVYHKDDPNIELARNNFDFSERASTADELKAWDVRGFVTRAYVTKWVLENQPELAAKDAA